jgi:2-dehydro-3-deoxyphosphogluconate aldolase / (4S)-4-hydroxy-2-oxoglutarate aldolase
VNGRAETVRALREAGAIAVVRTPSAEAALACAHALHAGGLRVVEVTLTVPGAAHVIRRLAGSGNGALVGAGSVLDAGQACACIAAGARFLVSPVLSLEVMACAHRHGVAAIPGALTPTEILNAWNAGADFVKVFPAAALGGASYIRALKAPLPQVGLVATGGVTLANAGALIEAGAAAVGVGGDLLRGTAEEMTAAAHSLVDAVRAARGRAGLQ